VSSQAEAQAAQSPKELCRAVVGGHNHRVRNGAGAGHLAHATGLTEGESADLAGQGAGSPTKKRKLDGSPPAPVADVSWTTFFRSW
jgi:hypothetical protein